MLPLAFHTARKKPITAAVAMVLIGMAVTFAAAQSQTATNARPINPAPAVAEEDARRATLSAARAAADTRAMLGATKFIAVRSQTVYLKRQTLESALRARKDFQESGLVLIDSEMGADVVIVVERAVFTTAFPFTAIDRETRIVVASGKVNSLFGSAAGKISHRFMQQVRAAKAPVQKSKP